MSRQIKGLLYFFLADVRYSLFIFWTILMSILLITLIVSYFLLDVENSFMTLSLTSPMYIYCAILGFLTVKESIPFSIKLGATRKNIFISLGLFFLGLSFAKAIVGSVVQVIVDMLNKGIGIDNFNFIHIAYFLNDSWLTRIYIDGSIMFLCIVLFFVLGLLFYKYGLAGGGIVVGLLVIIVLTGFAQGWLTDYFIHLYQTLNFTFFYKLLLISAVIYFISLFLLRKITIVKVK